MGYVFDFKDAIAYRQYCDDPRNGFAVDIQNRLLTDLLQPKPGDTAIEIGCGIGRSLLPMMDRGVSVTGLDPSPYMLDIAGKRLGDRVDWHRGVAESLPFEDNSFNYAYFMITLEFVDDPIKAIEEACRVAKDRLFIGVLNRYAIKGIQRRVKGVFTETIFNRARFFSVWEISQMLHSLLGDTPVNWRTVCHITEEPGRFLSGFEKSWILQRCPFGAFAGIETALVPRFRTRPLKLKYTPKQSVKPVAG